VHEFKYLGHRIRLDGEKDLKNERQTFTVMWNNLQKLWKIMARCKYLKVENKTVLKPVGKYGSKIGHR
jgi:hypothetical protein